MSKGNEKVAVVTQGPWLGRDGFVAETSVRFDRVEASVARLEREAENAQGRMEKLADEIGVMHRFESFEQSLRNSRNNKINVMEQGVQDLKNRLDAIQGKKGMFAGLTYKSFETIDKKLAELSALQARVERSDRNLRLCAVAFGAAILFAGAAAGYYLI